MSDKELFEWELEESSAELEEESYRPLELRLFEAKQKELVIAAVDYNLKTLADLAETSVNLSPQYQRRSRWDEKRQSRLIESLFINIPIPPIFLKEDDYGKYSVIDGKQRIIAIKLFLDNNLRLQSLELFPEINGLNFRELPLMMQQALVTRPTLRAIIVLRQSDPDIETFVFDRLNTAGISLNAQEIRNNIFSGNLNDGLIKESDNRLFHKMLGIKARERSALYKEMRDVELVLRYLTFRDTYEQYAGGMKQELDGYMKRHRDDSVEAVAHMVDEFEATLKFVQECFGEYAFRRWDATMSKGSGGWRKTRLASLFDAEMIAAHNLPEMLRTSFPNREKLIEAKKLLCLQPEFDKAIIGATNTPSYFKYRINEMARLYTENLV